MDAHDVADDSELVGSELVVYELLLLREEGVDPREESLDPNLHLLLG